MPPVQVIHNPGAGEEQHNRAHLEKLMAAAGYTCRYFSTKKKGWKSFSGQADLLVIAGGDGTVRKVVKQLLKRKLPDRPNVLAVLPLGTANNIARALRTHGDPKRLVRHWKTATVKDFDVGRLDGLGKTRFFLESFGCGLFPILMEEMKERGLDDDGSPEERIDRALQVLAGLVRTRDARECELTVDGVDHSGRFLMVEVMNTPSIGPNLRISPRSDPGDGRFEVVVVPEVHRERLAAYIEAKRAGRNEKYTFRKFRGQNVTLRWAGTHVHVDDEKLTVDAGTEMTVVLRRGLLRFLSGVGG